MVAFTGQLTTVGQQNAYELGTWLANEYITKHAFISPIFRSSEIYIRSTNRARTLQSAACLITGLYGKENVTETIPIERKQNLTN